MDNFSFVLPETNLLFGRGTLAELGSRAACYGKNALLVTGKSSMRRLGFLDKAKENLERAGIGVTLFEGVEPNPTIQKVEEGIEEGMENHCDLVVAIGGGSAIDAAKVMAVGIGRNDTDAWPFVTCEKETTDKTLPIIAIPSTSGTGSHVTWYTVITNRDTQEKAAYSSKHIFPIESVVDLDVVSTMPRKVTAETGFDALAHVMEAYVSKRSNAISDVLCLQAIGLVKANLVRAYRNGGDLDARYGMAVADTYAGICITSSRTVMVHGIGNTLSGVYPEVAHGQALACLTLPIMKYNIQNGDGKAVAKYCDIARALGEDVTSINKQNAMKSVDAVAGLMKDVGLEFKLSKCGVSEDSIEKMTDISLEHGMGAIDCNPVKPSREDIVRLYKEAL